MINVLADNRLTGQDIVRWIGSVPGASLVVVLRSTVMQVCVRYS